jgi:hypothetical protein
MFVIFSVRVFLGNRTNSAHTLTNADTLSHPHSCTEKWGILRNWLTQLWGMASLKSTRQEASWNLRCFHVIVVK